MQARYISALGMHFKKWEIGNKKWEVKFILTFCFLLLTSYFSLPTYIHSEVLDRVVAIVDDEAVMLSELNLAYQRAFLPQGESASAENSKTDITQEEVLNGLINRVLLLKHAKKFSHSIQTRNDYDENTLIKEYIEKQLKTFIRIPFEEIEQFYEKNKEKFGSKDFYDVRDEIEELLIEKELNRRLIKHIEELRKNAYIKIQLTEENY